VTVETLAAMAIAVAFGTWSAATQHATTSTTWDAVQYYQVAGQLAADRAPSAEAPYVYRLGLPWIAARFWPANPARGFFLVNVFCGLAAAPLLALWLRRGIARAWVRLLMVALFAASWHGPIRYVHFNSGYVDPPFVVGVLAALLIAHGHERRAGARAVAALTALTMAVTAMRETMVMVPASLLAAGNPFGRGGTLAGAMARVQWIWLLPLAAGAATIAATHAIVDADTTRSFTAAALQWIRKPPTAYVLAWFTAYGPALALLVFDWRGVARDLAEWQDLATFAGLCAVLAYFGGSDTERFVFWAMPVVYLLMGRAIERHPGVVRAPAIAAVLVAAQAVSARVFWTIPDPRVEAAPLGEGVGLAARLSAVADRLFVIDHFHWNLWSSFGSQPFRLARLGLYLAVTGLLVWMMARHERLADAR